MSIEFLPESIPPSAIIGLVGDEDSGITELLIRVGKMPGIVTMDYSLGMRDAVSRLKAITELDRLRQRGSSILLAAHDLLLLERICDEVWWLDRGRLVFRGDPKLALTKYRQHVGSQLREWGKMVSFGLAPSFRHGDGRAEVLSIETLGSDGKPTIIWKSGEPVVVRGVVRFHEVVAQPQLGLMIRTRIGFEVYGTNTFLEEVEVGPKNPGDVVTIEFSFRCELCPQAYTITLASHDPDGTAHDWLDDAIAVTVVDNRYTAGVANLRAKVTVE